MNLVDIVVLKFTVVNVSYIEGGQMKAIDFAEDCSISIEQLDLIRKFLGKLTQQDLFDICNRHYENPLVTAFQLDDVICHFALYE